MLGLKGLDHVAPGMECVYGLGVQVAEHTGQVAHVGDLLSLLDILGAIFGVGHDLYLLYLVCSKVLRVLCNL